MFLLFSIVFLLMVGVYVLSYTGLIGNIPWESVFKNDNPLVSDDPDNPSAYDKLDFKKKQEKLAEIEEKLQQQEELLKERISSVGQREQEILEIRRGIQEERKKLVLLTKDWDDRQKKIKDLANKVVNMPPDKAIEMMKNWKHFDVIDVLYQIDKDAALEDRVSLTPYLLTLFTPEERAEITRKMLLPPVTTTDE